MSLESLFDWFTEQLQFVLLFAVLVLLIIAVVKRSWGFAVAVVIAGAIIGIFVLNPTVVLDLAEWFQNLLNLGEN